MVALVACRSAANVSSSERDCPGGPGDLVYSFSNCCFWKALGVVVAEED